MLNSRLKELSDDEVSKTHIQIDKEISNNALLEIDNIIDTIIAKYSTSTGTVATFLVKDTAINKLTKIVTLGEAEEIWVDREEFVMDKIYEYIKRNRRKKDIKKINI